MFDDVLIESNHKLKKKGSWVTGVLSVIIHLGILGAAVAAGYWVKENPEVIEKPIQAFVTQGSPPPPPPPPPPPAASTSSTPRTVEVETPQTPRETFITPVETPQQVPDANVESSDAGAVEGGVVGGVEGGVVGGVVGGVIGGVIGGTLGGTLGGELGGTGDLPVRVGGDVKPPTVISRVDPVYTEVARKARIAGVVILEAVIDKTGRVTDVRVLKPLPMGLDAAAMSAVRQWRFSPGTLGGRAVPVIFSLTVTFRLQ